MPSTKDKQRAIAVLLDKYDRKHLNRMLRRKKVVDSIYNEIAAEAARIGVTCPFDDPDKPFYLKDYPAIEKRIDEMMAEFAQKIETSVIEGNRSEWLLSAEKNAAMIDLLAKGTNIPTDTLKAWKQPNLDALQAFQGRKTNGMGLSERVWNLSEQTKSQLELALDVGLGQGKSAAELSRDVRKFLKEPNKLFRRVRDKEGNLRLSKNAQAYHPGQGVYRSSYKNALRMTATENNMAYRTADHDKWNQLDFVIGIEVELSNNHTLNGVPFSDICDMLQGKYPKDFKFTGWHPFCRCIATPILADFDEVLDQMDSDNPHFSGEITDVPEGYNKWIEDNKERIASAKSMPYFIKDNHQYTFSNIANKNDDVIVPRSAILSKDEKESIVKKMGDTNIDIENVRDNAQSIYESMNPKYPILMPMDIEHADSGSCNPLYKKGKYVDRDYKDNCQCCVVTYEMRRRGLDVTALKYGSETTIKIGDKYQDAFIDKKGNIINPKIIENDKDLVKKFRQSISNDGRYIIGINKGSYGHVFIIEKKGKNIFAYDPQTDNAYNFEEAIKSQDYVEVLKVDNLLFNQEYANQLARPLLFSRGDIRRKN